MAEFTRVNGGAAPYTAIGRRLEWVQVVLAAGALDDYIDGDGFLVPESELEKIRRALDTVCSITIGGEPTATEVTFGCEGIGEAGADDVAWAAALEAKIDAATGKVSTVTFVELDGLVFA